MTLSSLSWPIPLSTHARSIFFNATATTEIYTLSLHDALPIWQLALLRLVPARLCRGGLHYRRRSAGGGRRSEEHTSELQSRRDLVCRLLLEKKNKHRAMFRSRWKNLMPVF